MPPHAILPTFRITFPYTVIGFSHVQRFYLATTPSADPSGFDNVARAGFANSGVSALPAPWWNRIKGLFASTGVTFQNAHLDQFIAGAWIPIWYEINAVVPTSANPTVQGGLVTWSGWDSSHEKLRVIFNETAYLANHRYPTYPAGDASLDSVSNGAFNAAGTAVAVDPYAWALSRENDYARTFTAIVISSSKHWRRRRGLG